MSQNGQTRNQDLLEQFVDRLKANTSSGATLVSFLEANKATIVRCENDKHLRKVWWVYVILPKSSAEIFATAKEVLVAYVDFEDVQPRILKDIERKTAQRLGNALRLDPDIAFIASDQREIRNLAEGARAGFSIVPLVLSEMDPASPPAIKALLEKWLPVYDRYYVTVPLTKAADLFGRRDELAELNYQLDRGQSIGVFGLRKAGKTSVLNAVRELRERAGAFVCEIDLSKAVSAEHFLKLLLEQVWATLLRRFADEIDAESLFEECSLECLGSNGRVRVGTEELLPMWFDDLVSMIRYARAPLELVVDEIDTIFAGQGSQFDDVDLRKFSTVLRQLRGLLQQQAEDQPRVVMLCAGVNPAIFESSLNPLGGNNQLYKVVRIQFLAPLSRDETALMVRRLGEKMGVKYGGRETTDLLFNLFGGHPMLTRAACSAVCKRRPEQVFPWRVELADINEVASATGIGTVRDQAREIKESFSSWFPIEAEVLSAIWSSESPSNPPHTSEVVHAISYGLLDPDGATARIQVVADAFRGA